MKRFIALFALLVVACGAPEQAAVQPTAAPAPTATPSCQILAADYIKQVEPLVREWEDAVTLAGSTPRVSLPSQIDKLQGIQRRTEALQVPECATTVQQSLVGRMGTTNRAFVAFLGQLPQENVDNIFALADEQKEIFTTELSHLKAGQPIAKIEPPFTDGLGVTLAALQAPYEKAGLKFRQRTLADGSIASDATSDNQLTTVEYIGSADKIQKAYFVSTEDNVDEIKANLHRLVSVAAPDWSSGSAWLDAALNLNKATKQVTATRGRVVVFERSTPNGFTTYTLNIEIP